MEREKKFKRYSLKGLLGDYSSDFSKSPAQTDSSPYKKRSRIGKDVFDFLSLLGRWEEIVGPKLAEHTYPLRNKNQTLFILSDHPAYAEQLSFMSEILKEKIFKIFPSLRSEVKRLKFEQCEKKLFEDLRPKISLQTMEEKKAPSLHTQSPLYKKLSKEAESIFKDVQDEELRKLLKDLYVQLEGK